jgi:hypothetical protein
MSRKIVTLYIKTHNKTGLKYFGKTSCKNPYLYKGSGKYWIRHIKTHGYDVTTEVVGIFEDLLWCSLFALEFSHIHDIVKSKEWANLKPEDGLDGGFDHINNNVTDDLKAQRVLNGKRLAKQGHKTQKDLGVGFYNSKTQSRLGKLGSGKAKELGVGAIFGRTKEQRNTDRLLCYTPEARANHSKTARERGSYNGAGNSQHNTKFIHNKHLEVSFRVKFDLVPHYLDQGWELGKCKNLYFSNGKLNKSRV